MTKIQGSADCGNSPKNTFVQTVAAGLEAGTATPEHLDPDVVWERPGKAAVKGSAAVVDACAEAPKPATVIVFHAISHGKVGAACGETVFADGKTRRFSHVLEFASAKADRVRSIRSYT